MLHRVQKSRRQLQGRDISLKQVYEIDTATIVSIHTPLSIEIVQNIIKSVDHDVFIFSLISNQKALVEFIHSDAFKHWLSTSDAIKQKFGVNIKLNIKYVDEDDRVDDNHRASCSLGAMQSKKPKSKSKPKPNENSSQGTIYIRRAWALIANHPTFRIEFQNYIRRSINISVHMK